MGTFYDYKKTGDDEVAEGDTKSIFLTPEEKKVGYRVLITALIASSAIFVGAYLLVYFFEIHYILKSVIALFIAGLALNAIDKSMGEKETRMESASMATLIILFLLSLLLGYQSSSRSEASTHVAAYIPALKSQVLTFEGYEERVFRVVAGKEYTKRVSGAAINYSNVYGTQVLTQEHGDYLTTADVSGTTVYHGSGAGSTLTIEWME